MHSIWKGINEIVNIKTKVFNSPSTIKSNGKLSLTLRKLLLLSIIISQISQKILLEKENIMGE